MENNAVCAKEHVVCESCGADDYSLVAEALDYEYQTVNEPFFMVRCNRCRLMYLNPRPQLSEISRIYPPNYTPYHFSSSKQFAVRIRRMREKKKVKKAYLSRMQASSGRILDFGCGDGALLEAMTSLAPPGWDVMGMDIDREAVAAAQHRNVSAYTDDEFQAKLQRKQWRFDLVIANQVIEHLPHPRSTIASVRQYLAPGGVFIIETPNVNSWDGRFFAAKYWDEYHIPRHWHIFEPETISRLLKQEGFRDIEFEYMFNPNIWVKSIKNYLLGRWGFPYKYISKYNPGLLAMFVLVDWLQLHVSGYTSKMRVIACAP